MPSHSTRPLASSTSAARESSAFSSSGSPTRPMSVQSCATDCSAAAVACAGIRRLPRRPAGSTRVGRRQRSGRSSSADGARAADRGSLERQVERRRRRLRSRRRRFDGTSASIAVTRSTMPAAPPAAASSSFLLSRFEAIERHDAPRAAPASMCWRAADRGLTAFGEHDVGRHQLRAGLEVAADPAIHVAEFGQRPRPPRRAPISTPRLVADGWSVASAAVTRCIVGVHLRHPEAGALAEGHVRLLRGAQVGERVGRFPRERGRNRAAPRAAPSRCSPESG